jgi:hypothetical protein
MSELGYRDNDIFGDNITDIAAVCVYETCELGNTDIIDYCIANYDLSGELVNKLENSISNKNEYTFNDELAKEMLNEIGTKFGKNLVKCLWLCDSSQDVVDTYLDEDADASNICVYRKSNIKLNDLGTDGSLYAYTDLEFDKAYIGYVDEVDFDSMKLTESVLRERRTKKLEDFAKDWMKNFNNKNIKDTIFGSVKIEKYMASDKFIGFTFDKKITDDADDIVDGLIQTAPQKSGVHVGWGIDFTFDNYKGLSVYPAID